jgi:hypothetical protein
VGDGLGGGGLGGGGLGGGGLGGGGGGEIAAPISTSGSQYVLSQLNSNRNLLERACAPEGPNAHANVKAPDEPEYPD